MTRDEHLKFCKICQHRKLDPDQGFICILTDKIADFESSCPNFEEETKIAKSSFINEREINKIREKAKVHQNLSYAIIGGLSVALLCSFIWAAFTVATEYQIGLLAIAVGFIVGKSVGFFGAGIDQSYGIIGAILALIGVLLGNIFSIIGFTAHDQNLGYFEAATLMGIKETFQFYMQNISPMDFVFYVIAIIQGYKFAFRPFNETEDFEGDLAPPGNSSRKILTTLGAGLILMIVATFFTFSIDGNKVFTYENGQTMSEGEYVDGKLDGPWTYYQENGAVASNVMYKNGLEQGEAIYFNNDGIIVSKMNYLKGLRNGLEVNYYENGILYDSSYYDHSRLNGPYASYHVNGNLMSKGQFEKNNQVGNWLSYYENGNLQSTLNYDQGVLSGEGTYYWENGNEQQRSLYTPDEPEKILDYWDESKKQIIVNGNGYLKLYYDGIQLEEEGEIREGLSVGIWKNYYEDGTLSHIYNYTDGEPFLDKFYDSKGNLIVENGTGTMKYFTDSNLPLYEIEYKNGLVDGASKIYNLDGQLITHSNFKKGKLNGSTIIYDENGLIQTEGNYIQGEQDGFWKWNNNIGTINSSITYINGKKEGEQLFYDSDGLFVIYKEIYKDGELISSEDVEN